MTIAVITQILEAARWAPSGDNTQPWRFQIVDAHHVVVHGFDTRSHCVYDLDGRPSQMSLGALLETIAIAASAHGLHAACTRRSASADTSPIFDIAFAADASLQPDPLAACITTRSVQRKPLRMRALSAKEKAVLEACVGAQYRVLWLEGILLRLQTARLLFKNAKLRLTMPEAYAVHRDMIEWNARFSRERIPDQALGIDPLTARMMRFVMQSWPRVAFFNRYLAGTWAPRIQMDFVPAIACAAHCVLVARSPATAMDDYVRAGRAMQRFWLSATQLGLQLQPEMTPLIFSRYVRNGVQFSATHAVAGSAQAIDAELRALLGDEAAQAAVFMARIGAGTPAFARSTRRTLQSLMVP